MERSKLHLQNSQGHAAEKVCFLILKPMMHFKTTEEVEIFMLKTPVCKHCYISACQRSSSGEHLRDFRLSNIFTYCIRKLMFDLDFYAISKSAISKSQEDQCANPGMVEMLFEE